MISLVGVPQNRGVGFHILTGMPIDITTSHSKFFFVAMSALAEVERELAPRKTKGGFASARAWAEKVAGA